jgi:hypothetical protein
MKDTIKKLRRSLTRVADLNKKEPIPKIVVYHHPYHIEKHHSLRQGRQHQHTYTPVMNLKGNQSRGTWRTTSTIGRHWDTKPTPWKHQSDVDQDQGGKEKIGNHVSLPLGWMDGHTRYQLATILSQSYCMVSSHVSGTKHA